jgi:hypothetical protein
MTTEVASKVEYTLSLANEHSKREGRWSTAQELIPFLMTEYGYSKVNPINVYNQLIMLEKDKQIEKKLKSAPWTSQLWRVVGGGGIAGISGSGPLDSYRSPDPWSKPEGGSPPNNFTEITPRPDGEWNDWGKARYDKNTKPQPDDPGMPMIAPVAGISAPISGLGRSVVQNLM